MARTRRVALLGNSVVASSLASTLRNRPECEVLQLNLPAQEAFLRLRDACPDVIILCELAEATPEIIFLLLGEYPGIPVIGADVDGDRMVVLSGRRASLRTEDDLLEAIRRGHPLGKSNRNGPEEEEEYAVGMAETANER